MANASTMTSHPNSFGSKNFAVRDMRLCGMRMFGGLFKESRVLALVLVLNLTDIYDESATFGRGVSRSASRSATTQRIIYSRSHLARRRR